MSRPLKHPFFIVSITLFTINYVVELAGYSIPYVHAYLDDLLAMPVIFTIVLVLIRWGAKKTDFNYSWLHLLVGFAYVSINFEWILPNISQSYTADWIDVTLYALGTLLYMAILWKPKTTEPEVLNTKVLR